MNLPLLLIGLAVGAQLSSDSESPESKRHIAYRCDDLVVVGRFENLTYTSAKREGDILGHGWITARVNVRRVLSGQVEHRVLTVRYFAHNYAREDRDFLLVVIPAAEGSYRVRHARLIDRNKELPLAPTCEP